MHLKLSQFLEATSKAVIAIPIQYREKPSEKIVLNDQVIASVVPRNCELRGTKQEAISVNHSSKYLFNN